jgi:SAM-dependent methyltransferase
MMRFLARQIVGAERWDALVRRSADGWSYSTSTWQDVINGIRVWGLVDVGFAVERDGELLAIMPLHHIPSLRQLSSTGWGAGGPVLAAHTSATAEKKILTAIYQRCFEVARQLECQKFTISISPLTQRSLANRWGINPLVLQGFEDTSTHTRIVELGRPEEALWADVSQSARQAMRDARNRGYKVVRAAWPAMLDEYYAVHRENYERTGVVPYVKEYFAGIAHTMAAAGHAVLYAGLAPDGTPVAFHNSARFNDCALYHTGASRNEHLDSGINYLLVWEAMLSAKRDGCRWYEVGEVFPGAKSGKEFGLSVMKSKFGGELHRSFRGEMMLDLARPLAGGEATPSAAATITPDNARRARGRPRVATSLMRFLSRTIRDDLVRMPAVDARGFFINVRSRWRSGSRSSMLLARPTADMLAIDAVDQFNRAKYSESAEYKPETISHLPPTGATSFSDVLLQLRLDTILKHITPSSMMLDLCCGNGVHLALTSAGARYGIGIDYSIPFVEAARHLLTERKANNATAIVANARALPFSSRSLDLIYSLSALYTISRLDEVLSEGARVLKPGGYLIADFGNIWSLNALVTNATPGLARTCLVPTSRIVALLRQNGFRIVSHRRFQLLPMWGDRPAWLRPLLNPSVIRLLERQVRGRMLDEWLASTPGLRSLAFRHFLVCQKTA